MKKNIFICLFIMFIMNSKSVRAEEEISSNLGLGFQIGQIQDDFGIGINLTSPYILYDKVALRIRGNIAWNQHIDIDETTWTPYTNLSIGIIGVGGRLNKFIRLYGEGGIILLFPDEKFSSSNMESGGYGLFGFEFFHTSNFNYFIEIGGVGTGAKGDVIPTKPIYSNGLLINAGLRYHF